MSERLTAEELDTTLADFEADYWYSAQRIRNHIVALEHQATEMDKVYETQAAALDAQARQIEKLRALAETMEAMNIELSVADMGVDREVAGAVAKYYQRWTNDLIAARAASDEGEPSP